MAFSAKSAAVFGVQKDTISGNYYSLWKAEFNSAQAKNICLLWKHNLK